MPAWVYDCCDDYFQRLPADYQINVQEIALEKRSKNQSAEKTRMRETQRLLQMVPENDFVVALTEDGQAISTRKFAGRIERLRDESRNISFLIGGPDGLDFSVQSNGLKRLARLALFVIAPDIPTSISARYLSRANLPGLERSSWPSLPS